MTEVINTAPSRFVEGMNREQMNRFINLREVTGDSAPELVAAMAEVGDDTKIDAFIKLQRDFSANRHAVDLVGQGGSIRIETYLDLSVDAGAFVVSAKLQRRQFERGVNGGEYYVDGAGWDLNDDIWPGLAAAALIYYRSSTAFKNTIVLVEQGRTISDREKWEVDDTMKILSGAIHHRFTDGEETSEDKLMLSMLEKMGVDVGTMSADLIDHNMAKARMNHLRYSLIQNLSGNSQTQTQ